MKILKHSFVIALFICSCSNPSGQKNQEKDNASSENALSKADGDLGSRVDNEKIIGSYVGWLGENADDNKICLMITKVDNKNIEGRSIVGGNDRRFAGTLNAEGNQVKVNAKEPGDNENDGEFNFIINLNNPDQIQGNWASFKNSTVKKQFTLNRKAFHYNPTVGNYSKASTQILNTVDVENLPKYELSLMRNEIFARHGYCFKKKEIRMNFESYDWYIPRSTDVTEELTKIEKDNIALIQRYEKYATDYGDEFGR
jgi:hypothetical protein